MLRKLIILAFILSSATLVTDGQSDDAFCDTVRYMMAQEITPYDLSLGGGIIEPDVPFSGSFSDQYYADTWTFQAFRPRNDFGVAQTDTFSAVFDANIVRFESGSCAF